LAERSVRTSANLVGVAAVDSWSIAAFAAFAAFNSSSMLVILKSVWIFFEYPIHDLDY
jgi:hypothetical protein